MRLTKISPRWNTSAVLSRVHFSSEGCVIPAVGRLHPLARCSCNLLVNEHYALQSTGRGREICRRRATAAELINQINELPPDRKRNRWKEEKRGEGSEMSETRLNNENKLTSREHSQVQQMFPESTLRPEWL